MCGQPLEGGNRGWRMERGRRGGGEREGGEMRDPSNGSTGSN